MPNAPRNTGQENTAKPVNELAFEEALRKLEGIVEELESQELPLDGLLGKYEEGVRLSKVCQEKLASAEVKIQQLEQNAAGEMKLKPLSGPSAQSDQS